DSPPANSTRERRRVATGDELRDIEEIRQLKARYFRLLDTKRWGEWRKLFTDDCRYDLPGAQQGADEFVAMVRARPVDALTVHHSHQSEIVSAGPGTARGVWGMSDWVEHAAPVEGGVAPGHRGFTGHGYYEEEYRKEDGAWKISRLCLSRLAL